MKLYLLCLIVAGLLYILALEEIIPTIERLNEKIEARHNITITE